ncbi:uncharacterized protein LTR77_009509 [Saxophila tyrrhenica]|uniref:Uncharacterized protein n=1 Tax=Saxophila tyrrhenica TaxID=1690608 RepID=A0AAV9P1Z3_9PEZI|nr:hypothetical protein LTR77_009509 [Saxophila tyrrhenica]
MFGFGPAAALLLAVSVFTVAADDTCYLRRKDQIITKNDWVSCPNTGSSSGDSLCCRKGDVCGPDSLCHTPTVKDGNEWYLGGCTNKDYKGSVCNKACSSYHQTWAVYNNTGKGYWTCCGDFDCDDAKHTTKMFDGVSPSSWKPVSTAGSKMGPVSSGSSGLSRTAKIGIAVGVAVAVVIAIVGGIVGFCLRKKRAVKKQPAFGRSAKKQYEQIDRSQGDIQMAAPFVAGENQPYSRPPSPPGGLAPRYSDDRIRTRSTSNPPPFQPPRD